MYETSSAATNKMDPGTPESFNVIMKETVHLVEYQARRRVIETNRSSPVQQREAEGKILRSAK